MSKREFRELVRPGLNSPYLEVMAFPKLFSNGTGSYDTKGNIKPREWIKLNLLNLDDRFRKSHQLIFFELNRYIKNSLMAQQRLMKRVTGKDADPSNKVTARALKEGGNPAYEKYGAKVPVNIPGSRSYWWQAQEELHAITVDIENLRISDDDEEENTIVVENEVRSGKFFKRKTKAVIRYPFLLTYGKDQEKYCLKLILEKRPWNRETIKAIAFDSNINMPYLRYCIEDDIWSEREICIEFLEQSSSLPFDKGKLMLMATIIKEGNYLTEDDYKKFEEFVKDRVKYRRQRGSQITTFREIESSPDR
ncbi:hypothetical protein FQR65_LT17387 [Abscondita terminalis]|nr:hypothetical protein FQR65_LT17387 [Abscondita terminalis]